MIFRIAVCVFILHVIFCRIDGTCFTEDVMKNIVSSPHGDLVERYCEYSGRKYYPGASFKDTERCVECHCSTTKLLCCGYGIASGVFGTPEGCKSISHHCQPYMVKLEDETLDCLTGQPISIE